MPGPLLRLRRLCLALPDAWEKVSHGEPTFWVGKKMFASFANAANHHGAGRHAVWCNATHVTQDLLLARAPDRYFRPPYVGPSGWIGIYLDKDPDWAEVAERLQHAHELAARSRPKSTRARGRGPILPALGALLIALPLLAAPHDSSLQTAGKPSPLDLRAAASELPQLRSLLVSWRGDLVAEYYANGVRASGLANIKSASKSIIAALVGIAIERGLIKNVREPIATYFPEVRQDVDRRKQTITVEDLLTMRSGLESTSGRNYGSWVQSRNWVRAALAQPMVSDPGSTMEYSTGSSHLLSAILTKATRISTWQFAQQALAKPLGITLARWPQDPQGIYFGGNEMLLTPKQMLAIGELYLKRGNSNGRQIVPASWVDTACVPRTTSVWDPDRRYGYGWWIQEFNGGTACFAWGYGGQYILVFRELNLVVTATSSTTVSEERRGHRRRLFELIEQHVLRPVLAASNVG
jgi:CubicO group peptidase (beta-lactamase class C family)/predicted DNA-binding protein (MmcQ/YjbR family)